MMVSKMVMIVQNSRYVLSYITSPDVALTAVLVGHLIISHKVLQIGTLQKLLVTLVYHNHDNS